MANIWVGYRRLCQDPTPTAPKQQDPSPSQALPATAENGIPPPLAPSVEDAYKKKCVDIRRRQIDVEAENDKIRLRIERLNHGTRKLRLNRALLFNHLASRMKKSGHGKYGGPKAFRNMDAMYGEESDGSSQGPPTPDEKPLRSKRAHTRRDLPQEIENSLMLTKDYDGPSRANGNPAPNHPMTSQDAQDGSNFDQEADVDMDEADEDLEGEEQEEAAGNGGGFTAVNN